MKLSSDILYNHLSEQANVDYLGRHCDDLALTMPMFYRENMSYQDGVVYIGRAGELPPPPPKVRCLIVSVGGRFPSGWNTGRSCVFSVLSETDFLSVFNIISETFSRYEKWESDMRQILDGPADLTRMVEETAQFFGCSIAVNDNQLQPVCRVNEGGASLTHKASGGVSLEEAKTFAMSHHENIAKREPFLYQTEESICYCTNIYIHELYWGLVTIECPGGTPSAGEKALYDYFNHLVYMTICRLNRKENNLLITPKSVFLDLLNGMPVSHNKLQRICGIENEKQTRWQCYAARPGRAMENLPLEYFCLQMEKRFPQCCAMPFGDYMVVFFPLHEEEPEEVCYADTEPFFRESGLYAGVSYPFSELPKARGYFRQAATVLKAVAEKGTRTCLGTFREYALSIALSNSMGEFPVQMMIPPELLKMREENADYWHTLKCYLNNEMNTTQTARELFIHRTTLQARIQKIHQIIDLSTAEKRMYVRYCIFLCEQEER